MLNSEFIYDQCLLSANSNITSFIGYVNNTMIKLLIYFNLRIDEQIINIIPR